MSDSHSHSHTHTHGNSSHTHSHDVTEDNLSHWNPSENASTYNTKFSKTITQIIAEIQARTAWIGVDWIEDTSDSENEETTTSSSTAPQRTVRLLDYACGTGLVSRALAPHITHSIGLDISPGMVSEYNTLITNQGIPPSSMTAKVGNLLNPSDPSPASLSSPEFFNFDIAAVGLGFHHFEDPFFAAKQLVARLKVGGVLLVIDFLPHEHGHGHAAAKTVVHHGFEVEEVRRMFGDAGAGGGFDLEVLGRGVVFKGKEGGEEMRRSVFMARGTKV
ncbi:hypothetical protein HYFRA_00008363 [Hymenoscyphus fraxineus]|uniref:Methyltransferase type 12 domain-containing protein n=1 Tax=Hymenoscyphus fraxineus TaxID=746836 RepID=A0A9N9KP05_9HELO|nr:hypothetical protein HYFRA_00008363 [Hymenoscyphus fraxineus]